MWSITLQIESNSSTVKHTASGVTQHQNMFGVRFYPIRPDVLVIVSGLMRVKGGRLSTDSPEWLVLYGSIKQLYKLTNIYFS